MQKLYLTNKFVNAALCTTEGLEIIIDDVADVTVLEDIRSAKTLRVAREILLSSLKCGIGQRLKQEDRSFVLHCKIGMSGNVMSSDNLKEDAARQCALGNPAACDH